MELLDAFHKFAHPKIESGVYDIHSPHLRLEEQMEALIQKCRKEISDAQL